MNNTNNRLSTESTVAGREDSFADIFFLYFNHWKWFALSISVCFLLAAVYLRYATKEYTVVSKVLIKDNKKGKTVADVNDAFNDLGLISQKSDFDNELEILGSRTLLKEVSDSLGLGVGYFAEERFKKREIYTRTPIFVSVSNQTGTGRLMVTQEAEGAYSITSDHPDFKRKVHAGESINSPWGILTLTENPFGTKLFPVEVVIVNPKILPHIVLDPINKLTTVIKISVTTPVPQKGVDIINTLVKLYNKKAVDEKNYVTLKTIQFIEDRLLDISGELQIAEKEVENYQRSVGGIASASAKAPMFMAEATDYLKKIFDMEVELSLLRDIKRFLLLPENKMTIVPTTVALSDPTVVGLLHAYNETILAKEKETMNMTADNPFVKQYNDKIALLKDNVIKGINVLDSSMEMTLRELKRKQQEYESKTIGLATQERESRELYRQQTTKETLFTYLLQKKEEMGLSLALATPNAITIDVADYSSVPVKPKTRLVLLTAIFAGFLIPIVVIYVLGLFDNKLHRKEQLTKVVKAPFLGEVPVSKSQKVFPVLNVRSGIAEKFRMIVSNLNFLLTGSHSKIIMVTSSYGGEGKSFFSQNLAMSLATTGKKTLLIDLDLCKSVLNKTLEIAANKGIALFLADPSVELSEIIGKEVYHKNLDIIPIKVFPPNPTELLSSNRLDFLLQTASKEYDYIVIDTAPIGLVADAYRINAYADASIYVTRADYTYQITLHEIQQIYESRKLHNMSTVINAVSMTKPYGYYGNSDEHSYYIEETKDAKTI